MISAEKQKVTERARQSHGVGHQKQGPGSEGTTTGRSKAWAANATLTGRKKAQAAKPPFAGVYRA